MLIQYATYDEEDVDLFERYSHAVEHGEGKQIWLFVDSWPVWEDIPSSFDRRVVSYDGQEILTAVIRRKEAYPQWGPNGFGGHAPLLTIDLRNESIAVTRSGQRSLLWPQDIPQYGEQRQVT